MTVVHRIGVMQGRLVSPVNGEIQAFPAETWADEFPRAQEAGIDCIEWIFDLSTEAQNPIWTVDGPDRLRALTARHGVSVLSVCADYFIRRPLLNASENDKRHRLDILLRLVDQAKTVGVNRIVLPFVDGSSISTDKDRAAAIELLRVASVHGGAQGVELHLETDFGPADFARFLHELAVDNIRVNYDSGNSAGLGYAPAEEMSAYGDRLGSVHIKDRVRGGSSVPLGDGNADFPSLFRALRQLDYRGDFILQTARGQAGDEVVLARHNRATVERWLAL